MRLKRGFVDTSFGQIHYRSCGSGNGGVPLFMFHGSPGSSFSLSQIICHMGASRHAIAPDTPGNGDSTPLPDEQPSIGDYAEAHAQGITGLGFEHVDLYGFHTGASIAIELSIRHPGLVRRMILDGTSLFDPGEQSHLLGNDHAPELVPDLDGTQLMRAWSMVRDAHVFWPWWDRQSQNLRGLGLPDAGHLHGELLEVLKAPRTYCRSYRAALRYPKREQLPKVSVPTLAAAAGNDMLAGYLDAVVELIPCARKAATPGNVTVVEDPIDETARVFLDFLAEGD